MEPFDYKNAVVLREGVKKRCFCAVVFRPVSLHKGQWTRLGDAPSMNFIADV